MKKADRTKKLVISGIVTTILVTGGALTYGFQGVLASLGLLSLIMIAVFGIFAAKRARLYSGALKFAEAENAVEDIPVTDDDAKWIINHLDEFYRTEVKKEAVPAAPVNTGDRKWIMSHIDEFFTEGKDERNFINRKDKKMIMDNIHELFFNKWEQDRQQYSW